MVKMKERRYHQLKEEQNRNKLLKLQNKPLGPKNRIYSSDKTRFISIIEKISKKNLYTILTEKKQSQWRQFVVRLVCSSEGPDGDELREIWKSIYKGDLKWGVRDMRLLSKRNGWPVNRIPKKKDRNSWIAESIRRAFVVQKKN